MKEDMEFYSPLYSTIKFKKVRPFNPMHENSPLIIEFETMAKNVVLFNHEGKPIIFHPSGEMIYEANLGECMIYPTGYKDWEKFLNDVNNIVLNNSTEKH